jgi:CheY-like chemotaxis protein
VQILTHSTLSKVHLVTDLDPDLRPLRGDANALTNAIMNLCVNAVDAMPEQGVLTLRTRNHEPGQVEIQVQDTGCGMAPEVQTRALDPFFTTKPEGKGTGLGLSIVFAVVSAHQGRMELDSRPGEGTRVTLWFPAAPEADRSLEPAGAPVETPAPVPLEVLLVEDDELVQLSLREALETLGHRVRAAGSGEQALQMVAEGLRPDVVLLDLNMPGLGGARTLPRLRDLLPRVPVVVITGRPDQTVLDLVREQPGLTLMPKPFTREELRRQLAEALES